MVLNLEPYIWMNNALKARTLMLKRQNKWHQPMPISLKSNAITGQVCKYASCHVRFNSMVA